MALVFSMRLMFRRRACVAGNPSSYHSRITTVTRQEPELIGPARPTPRETKRLSDIDDQQAFRWHVPLVLFYRQRVGHHGDHPAAVVRRALGEALVPYHPLAGRLREVEGRKLVVDCTGEGVLFVEADADVRLAELEAAGLRPPFPDQLFFDVEGSGGVINTPLLLIQVTRLLCGGFVVSLRLNHTMCDGVGIVQFLSAVGELARGHPAPTISPPWSRELLEARSPSEPTFPHHEYDPVPLPLPPGDMITRTFTFTPTDIAALKKRLPPHLRDTATTFDVLVASLWIARTTALEIPLDERTGLAFPADVRGVRELGLPPGYYGNAILLPAAVAAAGALRGGGSSLGHAVELVREAKKVTASAEYVRSTVDLLALRGRPPPAMGNTLFVSDNRRAGFDRVDFGWGQPVYGGTAIPMYFNLSFFVAVRNGDGEDAIGVPVMLPQPAMDRFASEIKILLSVEDDLCLETMSIAS